MGEPARVIQGPWAAPAPTLASTTARVFTADLPASWPGYAPRDGQLSLTRAVAETIEAGGGLIAEGPCGTGKGLAYLVPAILRAQASGRGALVATASIALQEQLVAKDLPALAEVWRKAGREPFTWALLKGRSNYLCKARADYSVEHARDLARIDTWARTTPTGDRAELPFAVTDGAWALRSSTQDDCLRDGCEHYGSCHAMEARTRAAEVDVLVVNHHLLAAHIAVRLETGADVVLPRTAPEGAAHAWDCVVVDEAHELGDIARDFLGADFGPWSVAGLARWARDVGEDRVSRDVSEAWDALWLAVERLCPAPARGQADKPAVLGEGRALDRARIEVVGETLGAVAKVARRIAREAKDDVNAPGARKALRRAENTLRRVRKVTSWLEALGDPAEHPDVVLWADAQQRDRGRVVHLHGRHLDVGELLRRGLWAGARAAIATSATMTTGQGADGWGWIKDQLGAHDARTLSVASPFDFARQALLCVPREMPGMDDRAAFDRAVLDVTARVARAARGRTLGLYTSRRMATEAGQHLRAAGLPWPVMVQGEESRAAQVDRMRREAGVLLGTSSLWTGVDLQGESVVAVVVDKLPFPPPDDPVLQALCDRIARETGDRWAGWRRECLPRAVLRLRQGVGRLIRSGTDWGVVVVCDARLHSARYGRGVVAALGMPAQVGSVAGAVGWLEARHGE